MNYVSSDNCTSCPILALGLCTFCDSSHCSFFIQRTDNHHLECSYFLCSPLASRSITASFAGNCDGNLSYLGTFYLGNNCYCGAIQYPNHRNNCWSSSLCNWWWRKRGRVILILSCFSKKLEKERATYINLIVSRLVHFCKKLSSRQAARLNNFLFPKGIHSPCRN